MIWFAGFAFLAVTAFFYPLSMAFRGRLLCIGLPSLAAATAGFAFGSGIRTKAATCANAVWAGVRVAVSAVVIFCAMFAAVLPIAEPLWKPGQTGSFFLLTLIFGAVLAGPLAVAAGGLAGACLYWVGRWSLGRSHPDKDV